MSVRRITTTSLAAALAGTLALSGCTVEEDPADPGASEEPTSATASASPGDDPGGLPSPGTAEQPAPVQAVDDPLAWVDGVDPLQRTVLAGSTYTLTVRRNGDRAVLEGGGAGRTLTAPEGFRFNDTLLDEEYAVVVAQDRTETDPSIATIIELATGETTTLDGQSDPATVNGGSWAIGQGQVFHATFGPDGAYCLAEVDLETGAGQTSYCAEPRTGFNQVRRTPAGLSLLSFDNGRPACRTVLSIGEAAMEPFEGVEDCAAWEGMVLPEGAIWTVLPKENEVELGAVRARVGEGYYDLGSSLTGSLTWCSGAAYFSSNQETDTSPARLLRWDGESLAVVLEAGEGGASSISAPRCGGDAITVSVLAESGDQQLTAPLG